MVDVENYVILLFAWPTDKVEEISFATGIKMSNKSASSGTFRWSIIGCQYLTRKR